jgi:DNA polymerase-3 subunit chi
MPRVDFYVLATTDPETRETFACRLAEKAWQQGYRVFVRTPDQTATERLDERLWTFREASFVPHAPVTEADSEPVVIGDSPPEVAQVQVNLGEQIDPDWRGYERITEIVTNEPTERRQARERFRAYRDAGVEPVSHHIDG